MSNTLAGIAIGGATGTALIIADVITAHNIELKDAVGVVVFISGMVWWLGRKFQKIEDKVDACKIRLDVLPCVYTTPKCETKE